LSALKKGLFNIPKWVAVTTIIIGIAALLISIAALVLLLNKTGDAHMGESCLHHECYSAQNLICTDNICACDVSKYYTNKCSGDSQYDEVCSVTADCASGSNMICYLDLCGCSDENYWDGSACVAKKTNSEQCSASIECLESLGLICNSVSFTCTCNDTDV
jgi:hypothetical protein